MPRKQNGWGTSKSLAFKPMNPVTKSKGYGANGNYPSDRRYGSSVTRSVVEKYDMDSDWSKWRKGYEYYMKAAWDELVVDNPYYGGTGNRLEPINPNDQAPGEKYVRAELESLLYQGTSYELPTTFYGWAFPTKRADTNTHYVVKREPADDAQIGTITEVWNWETKYPEQKAKREIWTKGRADINARLLLQMEGERLTDGETEATLKYVLTSDGKPALYKGKTFPTDTTTEKGYELQATTVKMRVPVAHIQPGSQRKGEEYAVGQGLKKFVAGKDGTDVVNNPTALIGNVIYVPDFYIEKPYADLDIALWAETQEYLGIYMTDVVEDAPIYCLDPGVQTLPVSMYDIKELPTIFTADTSELSLQGTFIFRKQFYNQFFPGNYATADQVESEADVVSYAVLPFTIKTAYIQGEYLILESLPFASELKLYPEPDPESILVWADHSFCKYSKNGEWTQMYTDVQPWQDEVFTSGNPLQPATTYTCSCPDYSHAILLSPQATEDFDTRKTNRQRRYPLPSVQGLDTWSGLGLDQVSGKISSWDTAEHRCSLHLCKHSIAARFIEKIQVIEPSAYPSVESRLKFEEKLEKEVNDFGYDFRLSQRRSQISLAEIIFALAQGLNLDHIETAYVLFNS